MAKLPAPTATPMKLVRSEYRYVPGSRTIVEAEWKKPSNKMGRYITVGGVSRFVPETEDVLGTIAAQSHYNADTHRVEAAPAPDPFGQDANDMFQRWSAVNPDLATSQIVADALPTVLVEIMQARGCGVQEALDLATEKVRELTRVPAPVGGSENYFRSQHMAGLEAAERKRRGS